MDDAAVLQKVSELPLLTGLSDHTRRQLAEVFLDVADVLLYGDGEPLISIGYLSFETGYVLVDGKVAIERGQSEPLELVAPVLLGEMAQFSATDTRSASVRARGSVMAAQFYWDDLYRRAEEALSAEAHSAFRFAIENQIWKRFEYKEILNLPLFADLPEALRMKVCLPFPALAECVQLKEVDTLFNQGSLCKNTGHLLVKGELKLFRKDGGERTLTAPDIIGIFPVKNEKGKEWSATAMGKGRAEVLKFAWDLYTDQIVDRLSHEEQKQFVASLKNNASKHLWC